MPDAFQTRPHAAHAVRLIEDHKKFDNRIYEITTATGHRVGILGSELDSLLGWWLNERQRPGETPEDV